jgi:ABC-type proline/glycine betaine transport system ATPase subunit
LTIKFQFAIRFLALRLNNVKSFFGDFFLAKAGCPPLIPEDIARYILDMHEEQEKTIVLIEHGMGLVMEIAQRVVVLNFGFKIAEGRPEDIKNNEEVIKAYLGSGGINSIKLPKFRSI